MVDESSGAIRVVLGSWEQHQAEASRIRHEVFVVEQHVPPEEELDERDVQCIHAVAYSADGTVAGTGRLLPDGHIGRMAVRQAFRGKGVGGKILTALVDEARRRGHLQVVLAAQVHARQFYELHGFVAEGPIFLDAGIDHVNMRRDLTA